MRLSAVAAAVACVCVALLAAGCGGGSSAGSSSTAPEPGAARGAPGGGPGGGPKRATAPNAPAGSKVLACAEGAAEMEQLRATAVDCGAARQTMRRWGRSQACAIAADASRSSCALGGFRCQAVRTGQGAAVSCARPGADVAFLATGRSLRKSGSG